VTIQPRPLILKLILGADEETLSARAAIACCALFGIQENSVRVALNRLAAAGMIEGFERGRYRLGDKAAALAGEVRTWRSAESRTRSWDGGYVAVHVGGLGRTDRAAVRTRGRAFDLLGFRELEADLVIRPDNLAGGVAGVRERLVRLGVDAPVFHASELDPARDARARSLWDGKALTRAYVATREKLDRWLAKSDGLSREAAARESFLLGSAAIRTIVFDPLLPAPLVDVDARRALVASVKDLDQRGHAIWRALFGRLHNAEAA
jgi:phenylacetic acid degradation operon negative regulatory protein